jgi:hypothetical protein
MRLATAMLVGTTALALAFGTGSAIAKTRHYHRHHAARQAALQAPQPALEDTTQNGNNPAKRYAARHDANARQEATLSLSGNNPTKRYAVRHDANARMEATLSTSGNNPVKKYPAGIH